MTESTRRRMLERLYSSYGLRPDESKVFLALCLDDEGFVKEFARISLLLADVARAMEKAS